MGQWHAIITPMLVWLEAQSFFSLDKIYFGAGVAVIAILALIALFSKKEKQAHATESRRAESLDKLLQTREKQLADMTALYERTKCDLDATTSEYKALAGINIKELINFAALNMEITLLKNEASNLYGQLASKRHGRRGTEGGEQ